jgi:hypothetical protein
MLKNLPESKSIKKGGANGKNNCKTFELTQVICAEAKRLILHFNLFQ